MIDQDLTQMALGAIGGAVQLDNIVYVNNRGW